MKIYHNLEPISDAPIGLMARTKHGETYTLRSKDYIVSLSRKEVEKLANWHKEIAA